MTRHGKNDIGARSAADPAVEIEPPRPTPDQRMNHRNAKSCRFGIARSGRGSGRIEAMPKIMKLRGRDAQTIVHDTDADCTIVLQNGNFNRSSRRREADGI